MLRKGAQRVAQSASGAAGLATIPKLELCCDCADAIFMKQMLRGDFGKLEQREARESQRAGTT